MNVPRLSQIMQPHSIPGGYTWSYCITGAEASFGRPSRQNWEVRSAFLAPVCKACTEQSRRCPFSAPQSSYALSEALLPSCQDRLPCRIWMIVVVRHSHFNDIQTSWRSCWQRRRAAVVFRNCKGLTNRGDVLPSERHLRERHSHASVPTAQAKILQWLTDEHLCLVHRPSQLHWRCTEQPWQKVHAQPGSNAMQPSMHY